MVSVNPNPVQAQGFYIDNAGMALPGVNSVPPSTAVVSYGGESGSGGGGGVVTAEDVSKKVRKPYTITKSRENWTEQEHDKFLEALQLFDRDWKKIEAFVGSKTVIQIRSHAQKYFLKVQKTGSNERVPPPRPKRKAAHPYPQKASKIAHATNQGASQPTLQCQALPPAVLEPGYVQCSDLSSVLADQNASAPASSWTYGTRVAVNSSNIKRDDAALAVQMMTSNCCSSSNESGSSWPNAGPIYQNGQDKRNKVIPDFAQVYSFIGSIFDPNVSDHLQRLKRMDPINVETALLLMRNLSANLLSPEFEEHRKLLSSYDVDSGKVKCSPRVHALDNSHTAIPAV